jgi:hypothetical protein
MRHAKKRISIALLILSLFFFGYEAAIWVKSTANARTETDKQNILGHRQPNEIPAIAGIVLLLTAAVVASTPNHTRPQNRPPKNS